MSFENPWLLLLLLLALPIALLWRRSVENREERIKRFSESAFSGKLFIGSNAALRNWHFYLLFAAIIFLFITVSGPVMRGGKEKVKTSGIDIVIALDVSNSMRAKDIQPSRLERAKLALEQTIAKMGGDRIGIVVFAGQAFTNLPLTDDHSAAQMVLESVTPDMISMQGTAIGLAIEQSVASFPPNEKDKDRGKAIIVISDGENHEDDAAEAAKSAAEKGIIVSAIGIGSENGEKIPEYDAQGNFTGNKLDEDGKEIVTKLDEENLKAISREGKGMYFRASASDMGIEKVYNMLQGLSKTSTETWRYTSITPLYRYFLAISILLFLAESFLPEGKRNEINSPTA
jgi:Ca-activated chloride channel family protein